MAINKHHTIKQNHDDNPPDVLAISIGNQNLAKYSRFMVSNCRLYQHNLQMIFTGYWGWQLQRIRRQRYERIFVYPATHLQTPSVICSPISCSRPSWTILWLWGLDRISAIWRRNSGGRELGGKVEKSIVSRYQKHGRSRREFPEHSSVHEIFTSITQERESGMSGGDESSFYPIR